MIRNEALLQLREAYIEIGKMVQKYGYGQYNGILRILMGQVNCIDSDESDGEKMKYLIVINKVVINKIGIWLLLMFSTYFAQVI